MKYTKLGRSGLKVSRLCLGTMNFGEFTDEKEAFRIMDAALDAGVNFFDTANHYGGSGENCGRTERIIGNWLSQRSSRRDQIVLDVLNKLNEIFPGYCPSPEAYAW